MKWNECIVADEAVLLGKPTIKGTRLSDEHIIGLLAIGWSEEQLLENYPRFSSGALRTVIKKQNRIIPNK